MLDGRLAARAHGLFEHDQEWMGRMYLVNLAAIKRKGHHEYDCAARTDAAAKTHVPVACLTKREINADGAFIPFAHD